MKVFFTGYSQVLGLFFVLIFIVSLSLSMTTFDAGRVVFNPAAVKHILTEAVTESDLMPSTLAWISELRAEERAATNLDNLWHDEPKASTPLNS